MRLYTHTHTPSIQLINGDCYEKLKEIPDGSVDLVIIDPPYEYTTGGGAGCFGVKQRSYHEEYYQVAKNTKEYKNEGQKRVWEDKAKSRNEIMHISSGIDYSVLDELDRILNKINIYIWCSKLQVEKLLRHYQEKGCAIDILTWHKTNPLPTMNNTYANDTEYLIFAREKGVRVYGNYETKRKYYVTPLNVKDKKLWKHPTIKPLHIIKNLIINSSQEGDTVLDCFMGSGTTGVACKELNRNFIGIEIDKKYFDIAQERINNT